MASPAIQAARVENSVTDTARDSVPTPPWQDPARPPSLRQQLWALPVLTVAALLLVAVYAAAAWPVTRYETAPGVAQPVANRLEILDTQTYEPPGNILFVTAGTSKVTGLQAIVGWMDPVVDVHTCHDLGLCDRPQDRRPAALGAMATAKQIAEYVATSRLGYDATLVEGPAQVGSFSADTCPTGAPPQRACNVLQVGDIIVQADGKPVANYDDLAATLEGKQSGDVITLTVERDGTPRDLQVELMAAPDDSSRTIIGFNGRDTRTVSMPFTVDIDTNRIGGPSAGLAFTLALIDELTPGDLTGGTKVAVTGEIDENGNVGAIGALPQKADAVRRAGATLFLVPAGQSDEEIAKAQENAGSGVEIVRVATLDEALAIIADHGGQSNVLEPATS